MKNIIEVGKIKKTFILSKKQMKTNNTKDKHKTAVDDLSFSIRKGEIYGLLGPNGAGKTTTLRILSTLIKPDSGDVLINGNSVVDSPDLVRSDIAFLTSELRLDDFFTADYLFDYYSALRDVEVEKRDAWKKYLFDKFEINAFKAIKISELSTGMKQKASIAISLVHNPDIIIFDEPTNGLDVITAHVVTDFLKELKEQGKTIIVSTHIFSLIEKICDRVGIIINGKMVLEDSLKEITKDKNLEEVFFEVYVKEVEGR